MWQKFKSWCGSNTASAKCTRTIFQVVIGAALMMAVLSLIQVHIGWEVYNG